MIMRMGLDELKRHGDLYNQMFKLRTQIFHNKLKWDVNIDKNGHEIDEFDTGNVIYIICVEGTRVVGTIRLLETLRPTMLSTVFKCLLDGETIPKSATIWESTRFAVDTDQINTKSNNKTNWVTRELLGGIYEYALENNITHIVSVFDVFVERILKRAGCEFNRIGKPVKIGRVKAVAAKFPISLEILNNIRQESKLSETFIMVA
ncbi:MAG: GNAT family N-acetyltransferase [Rhizobiales bacterium]|nr:GNAT family N-acetyltransferase [Hyphomicrobiales bacterium]